MVQTTYNWRRFWCPREGWYSLADRGYLVDPTTETGKLGQEDVCSFEDISQVQCLILLGEPGIGKSIALKIDRSDVERQAGSVGEETLWVDLRAYQTDIRLEHAIFRHSMFTNWLEGEHRLHVFLDSLDECLLRIDTVASLLATEFEKCSIDRLFLRIACRTADWPQALENDLLSLFGKENVRVFELLPLRRLDVEEAAKAEGVDHDRFLADIEQRQIVPLAIKPVTLNFLLNTYHKESRLPATQSELYVDGCRLLCEELSKSRRASKQIGNLSADQRVSIAGRIAAITVFCNYYAIWMEPDLGDRPEADIPIRELIGGKEDVSGSEVIVDATAVRETLSTGVFSSRGASRMGWAHQTYAEFLAARYLLTKGLEPDQIFDLISHPTDGKVIPQLRQVAAWLATLAPEMFQRLTTTDPEVLLYSEVTKADEDSRRQLVESLLDLYDREELLDMDWAMRREYRKLNHSKLADQLRPFITNQAKGALVRRVAAQIAEGCQLREVSQELLTVALDNFDDIQIRIQAAYAVARVGDKATRAKLRPLAEGRAGNDPEDELKGCALQALWPDLIAFEELPTLLTPPKRPSLHGAYIDFLWRKLVDGLQPRDLPTALNWVTSLEPSPRSSFEIAADRIILKALQHVDDPDIAVPLASTVFSRIRKGPEIVGSLSRDEFQEALQASGEARQKLIRQMLPHFTGSSNETVWLEYGSTPLLRSEDVRWLIGLYDEVEDELQQRTLANLVRRVFDSSDAGQTDAIIVAAQQHPVLAEEFAWMLKPIELGSEKANQLKAEYFQVQKWREKKDKRPRLDPPPTERIRRRLDEFESGDQSAFWKLNLGMTLESQSQHYGNEFEPDLTKLPGWRDAEDSTRTRIIQSARTYILSGNPETAKWLGTDQFQRSALAGYRAFHLLKKEDSGFLNSLLPEVWKRWAPIILSYPITDNDEPARLHHELIATCYQSAPDEILNTLEVLIDQENSKHCQIFIVQIIEYCWDEQLANRLSTKARDSNLKPTCMRSLLATLLAHNTSTAQEFAESLLRLPLPTTGDARDRSVAAGQALMESAPDAGWTVIWPAMSQDIEFGRSIISWVAHGPEAYNATIGSKLGEEQLANLYIWLAREFPPAGDPQFDEAHAVGPRESIGNWRDSILRYLENLGTCEAVEAIARIQKERPDLDQMKWSLFRARVQARQKTWKPPKPEELLALTKNAQARFVQSEEQLLDVIIKSLRRLEDALQGETPAARDIWDRVAKNKFRAVDENAFSDYVKRHLDNDLREGGIIANREVEIRRGEGSGTGERTDIHVDAIITDEQGQVFDVVTVIIETKGCWNNELNTAMKTQLLDRYLRENQCNYGLYLVGWFNCEQWDDDDDRKRKTPQKTFLEAREQFDSQAEEVSGGEQSIRAFVMNTALR